MPQLHSQRMQAVGCQALGTSSVEVAWLVSVSVMSTSREPCRASFDERRDPLLEVGRHHHGLAHRRNGVDRGGLVFIEREAGVGDGVPQRERRALK